MAAAYVIILLALLFVQGMKIIIQDGVDHRKATVVGLSFWIGVGFQNQAIFPDLLGEGFLSVLLGNGMTAGAVVAIIMMMFIEMSSPRRRRLAVALDIAALPRIDEFLRGFASKTGWDDASTQRLALVGEETLSGLLSDEGDDFTAGRAQRLIVTARSDGGAAELESWRRQERKTWKISWRIWARCLTYRTPGRYRSACCGTTRPQCAPEVSRGRTSSRCVSRARVSAVDRTLDDGLRVSILESGAGRPNAGATLRRVAGRW